VNWRLNGHNTQGIDKFTYLGMMLENADDWNKQKTLAKTKVHQALAGIDKCLLATPNINLQMLENTYEKVCK
jgi:hypothetical protein